MKPSEIVKSYGIKSLKSLAEYSNVPENTIRDWAETRPRAFRLICEGAAVSLGLPRKALEHARDAGFSLEALESSRRVLLVRGNDAIDMTNYFKTEFKGD